tara:strand:+ start:24768 stop:25058 length:291 start_codon:yes stop_codon:yes gene_type:complete
MRSIIVLLALVAIGCGEANWGPQSQEPCETHQENYIHTTIRCGDYYDNIVVKCDENNNYDRGDDCLSMTNFYDIVTENKPCSDCGCVVQDICGVGE